MVTRLKAHLNYANVTATLALAIALGGAGAYAAGKIGSADIARNAVKAKHIAAGQVGTEELAIGSVAGSAIAPSAVTSETVADGAIRGIDIGDSSLGSDDIGLDGLTGADIDESTLGDVPTADHIDYFALDRVSSSGFAGGGNTGSALVTCPSGSELTGGGAEWVGVARGPIVESYPLTQLTWDVTMSNETGTGGSFTAYAVCIDAD